MRKRLSLVFSVLLVAVLLGALGVSAGAAKQETIKFSVWDYSMSPEYKAAIDAFQKANPDIKVDVIEIAAKDYPDKMTVMLAAGEDVDVFAVKDFASYSNYLSRNYLYPLDSFIKKAKVDLKPYGGALNYVKSSGKLMVFPYRSDIYVLYYNKDIFKKAGLDENTPPKTWNEVWDDAKKIKESGAAACGYTSTWLTWIHLENFAAWNDVPWATNQNGLAGGTPELKINAPIYVNHFQALADLARDGTFKYGGRTSEAKQIFLAGECGIMTESSGGLGDIVKSGMNYGIGQLPYDSDAKGAPQNTTPGGASLWVMGGKSDEEYKGVAAFFTYLSKTEVQQYLHEKSGYLPVTLEAYEATKKSGFYDKNPGRETPILQMMGKAPTDNSKGVRLPNLPQVRDIQNEEFEKMLAGQETAQQALDNAVQRGNAAIKEATGG